MITIYEFAKKWMAWLGESGLLESAKEKVGVSTHKLAKRYGFTYDCKIKN